MGKGSAPSAPAAPDPNVTSAAQTKSNKETALYNFGLNNPDTTSPLGNLTFTTDTSDPNQPKTTENITLSPAEQQILDQNQANINQQGQTAGTALNAVNQQFQTPYDVTGNVPQTPSQQDLAGNLQNTQNALYARQTQYLDPQFDQGQQQLASQLANQGIPQGSQAYTTAMNNFSLQKQKAYSDARDSAVAGGTQAQAQEAQTGLANQAQAAQLYSQQYAAPLQYYNSLITGTQPTMPQFSGLNPSSAAPTNVMQAYNQQYQGQLNNYNAQVGASNSATSGLFGLGGSVASAIPWASIFSDRRLKKNIRPLGKTTGGIPIYEFQYKWDHGSEVHVGCMADEVEKLIPEAVTTHGSGYKMVNYGLIK